MPPFPRFRPQLRSAKPFSSAHDFLPTKKRPVIHSNCTSCTFSLLGIATCRKPVRHMFLHLLCGFHFFSDEYTPSERKTRQVSALSPTGKKPWCRRSPIIGLVSSMETFSCRKTKHIHREFLSQRQCSCRSCSSAKHGV